MKILVTGAAGQLGRTVAATFLDAGLSVTGTDLVHLKGVQYPFHVRDLCQPEAAYDLLAGMDALVHLGNIPNSSRGTAQEVLTKNVANNINMFRAACELGISKVIFASSVQAAVPAYNHLSGKLPPWQLAYLPADGNLPANPDNAYGLSKRVAEQMLEMYAQLGELTSAVALRYPWLSFSKNLATWPRKPVSLVDKGGLMRVATAELLGYLSYEDAASLCLACLQADLPGYRTYLPSAEGPPRHISIADCYELYLKETPLRIPLDEMHSIVDNSKITEETGWKPRHQIKSAIS